MKISFIIPAYNEEAMLKSCLDSVMSALSLVKCDAEVIVVNNASTDRTREIALSYKNVQVVDEPRKGLVMARQAGFLVSSGDLLANIDADTLPSEKWLTTVIDMFSSQPELMGLSGPYIYYDAQWYVRTLVKVSYVFGYFFDKVTDLLFNSGSLLQGGNFILRREALVRIGGFDTTIDFYGEDNDVGRRVRKIGKVIWTFKLPMYSSGRRFMKQGLVSTSINYSLNFIWISVLGRPFSDKHVDIRMLSE